MRGDVFERFQNRFGWSRRYLIRLRQRRHMRTSFAHRISTLTAKLPCSNIDGSRAMRLFTIGILAEIRETDLRLTLLEALLLSSFIHIALIESDDLKKCSPSKLDNETWSSTWTKPKRSFRGDSVFFGIEEAGTKCSLLVRTMINSSPCSLCRRYTPIEWEMALAIYLDIEIWLMYRCVHYYWLLLWRYASWLA